MRIAFLGTPVFAQTCLAALVEAGALDGLSIGFRQLKARQDGPLRVLTRVDLWEVSVMTFPMLPGARLSVVSASGIAAGIPKR